MFPYPFGPVYGGSNYNAATGAESRDLRPLSPNDPRYGHRLPGAMGGMGGGMRPTNKLPPGYGQDSSEPFAVSGGMTGGVMRPPGYGQEPVIMDGDGSFGPVPETGGITPLPFGESGPVKFSTYPARIKQPPQQNQSPDLYYIPEDPSRPDPLEYTGPTNMPSRQPGRGRFPDPFGGLSIDAIKANPQAFVDHLVQASEREQQMPGSTFLSQMGGGFGGGRQRNPFMGGYGGGFNQQMNPFMGGGGFNPFMGGGYGGGFGGQQMNPFMGGFNPFMGGGFGGFNPYQQMNPFMGGGFGGYNQQPQAMPYNQQVSQPANPFRNFGGF